MRDRWKKLVSFSLNFTYNMPQREVLDEKCLVFLLITNGIKNNLVAMRDRCKKISFFFTQFQLQFASRHSVRE